MSDLRGSFLQKLEKQQGLSILEIGALNKPFIQDTRRHNRQEIFYLDHMKTLELKEKYRHDKSVDISSIVNVDFVCFDGNVPKAVGDKKFDVIIASHVAEHIPNFIKWLQDLSYILNPHGCIYLVIPDKRFTFDVERPITTFGELLAAYYERPERPSVKSVYDHFSRARMVSSHDIWTGNVEGSSSVPLASEEQAFQLSKAVVNEQRYFDVHVSIFTPDSFCSVLRSLVTNDLLSLAIDEFEDTPIGKIEFSAVLRAVDPKGSNSKKVCLESIPDLPIDSLLSPYMPQVKSLSDAMVTATGIIKSFQEDSTRTHEEIGSLRQQLEQVSKRAENAERVLGRRSVRATLYLVNLLFKLSGKGKKNQTDNCKF